MTPTPTPPTGEPDIKFPVAPASAPRGDPPKFKPTGETPTPSDPRLTPKTLAQVTAEFRAMKSDALKRQEFEAAASCEIFARATENAERDLAALTAALEEAKKENGSLKVGLLQLNENTIQLNKALAVRDLELKGLREDRARLDWLLNHGVTCWYTESNGAYQITFHERAQIDLSMSLNAAACAKEGQGGVRG